MFINRIYSLSNPLDNHVFYIGKTALFLNQRLSNHISASRKNKSLKDKEILKILSIDQIPIIEIIEEIFTECEVDTILSKTEEYWIHQFSSWGFKLTNIVSNPIIWTKDFRSKSNNPNRNGNRKYIK